MAPITPKALQLILDAEGLDKPYKWPGGDSGITLDIGYVTVDQLEADWDLYLSASQMDRLRDVVGLRGVAAKKQAAALAGIHIKRADAEQVFKHRALPQIQLKTRQAFPGLERLWEGRGLDGLLKRRDAEAALVESCLA